MEDSRAEESSAVGNGGQAAISLTPDVDDTGSGSRYTFVSLKVGTLKVCL